MRATRGWRKTTGCDATHSPGCCGRAVEAEPLPVPHRPPRFVRRRGRTAAQPARRHGGIRRTAPPDARGRHAGRADQPSSTRDASYSAGGGHPNAHPALLLSPRTGRLPQPQSRRHGETPPTLRTQPQPHAPARTSIAVESGGGGGERTERPGVTRRGVNLARKAAAVVPRSQHRGQPHRQQGQHGGPIVGRAAAHSPQRTHQSLYFSPP